MRYVQVAIPALLVLAVCAASARAGDPASPAPAQRGYAGFHVEPLPILTPAQRAELGAKSDKGSVIALVLPDGPAAKAGLHVGDLLLKLGGQDVPPIVTSERYQPEHHAWRVATRKMLEDLKEGAPVEVVVVRDGKTLTLSITPVSEAELSRVMGGDGTPWPAPAGAGASARFAEAFDALPTGRSLPEGFRPADGRWQVVAESSDAAKSNFVLKQDRPVLPWSVLLVTGAGRALSDGHVKVRFQPVSGVVDDSAGIVFRAQDAKNYYVARANALEDNWNLYIVKDGTRTALKEMRVTPPAARAWHTMEVWFSGDALKATLDGKDTVEAKDSTFATGWCGLWTKADSVTLFDDWQAEPGATTPK